MMSGIGTLQALQSVSRTCHVTIPPLSPLFHSLMEPSADLSESGAPGSGLLSNVFGFFSREIESFVTNAKGGTVQASHNKTRSRTSSTPNINPRPAGTARTRPFRFVAPASTRQEEIKACQRNGVCRPPESEEWQGSQEGSTWKPTGDEGTITPER